MNPYSYKISLIIRHPSQNLTDTYQTVGKTPGIISGRLCNVGEQRMTPQGVALEGLYAKSWCGFTFTDKIQLSEEKELTNAVNEALILLQPHKILFDSLHSSGGEVNFFLGWFLDANSGDVFDTGMLQKLSELRIGLEFDLYPGQEMASATINENEK